MSNWLYYRTLTIDHDVIDSSLTDYPVMVKLDDTNFDFSKLRADGYDLIFTDDTGVNQLKHEVELFDGANEKAVYHVKIPSVSDTVDTVFRMYYGDPSVSTDQSDKVNVWDDNFVMVQHMGDSLADSTGNGNDGANYGSTVVDGLNGKARSFDGSDDYVRFSDSIVPASGDFSISFLTTIRTSATQTFGCCRFDTGNGFALFGINGTFRFDTNKSYQFATGYTLPLNELINVTIERTNTTKKLFVNGVLSNSTTSVNSNNLVLGSIFTFGASQSNDSSYDNYLDGLLEEYRVHTIARSDAWIKADDYNLRTYSLLSLGTETANKTITGIELLQEPTKTEYFLGESLDLTGAILEITYDDLSTQQVEPTSASGFDSSVESLSQTVTISLGGFSESFNVVIRNDYTVGQIITIKFTDSIVAESIDGNISAFKVTGKEYQWVDGPDNNGPLIDKEYQVVAVVPHPTLGDNHIRIIFDDYSRFPSVVGDITVEYDTSLGNLAGSGGPVESFTEEFTPTGLVQKPNPGPAENFKMTAAAAVDLLKVEYNNRYAVENFKITAAATITLTFVGVVNP